MWIIGFLVGAFFGVLSGNPALALGGGVLGMLVAGVLSAKTEAREKEWRALNKRLDRLETRLEDIEAQLAKPAAASRAVEVQPAAKMVAEPVAEARATVDELPSSIPGPELPWSHPELELLRRNPQPESPPPRAAPELKRQPEIKRQPAMATPPLPAVESEPGFWARLLQGNPLAKIGVVLLFFGIASALKVAAEHAVFPLEARLALAVVGALVLLGLGWRKREVQPMFGLAMQGGGIAILYLLVYLAFSYFALIGAHTAFAGFAVLGAGCVALALAQNGVSLAVLGMAGAFVAPLLAASGSGGQVLLFGYFALLNLVVLGLVWLMDWRALSRTGFIFTFLIGLAWGLDYYRPSDFAVSEFFLVLFFLWYSLAPLLAAWRQAPGARALSDGILLFGVPLAALGLQVGVVRHLPDGLAWSSFAGGLYYLALALSARRIGEEILRRVYLAIGAVLLALAVPLAFDAAVTAAFWALGGAGLIRLGLLREDSRSQTLGAALQFLGGAYFLVCWGESGPFAAPPPSEVLPGMIVLAVSGLLSGYWLQRERAADALLTWWGLLWWFAALGWIMQRYFDGALALSGWVGSAAISVALMEIAGTRLEWPALRQPAFLLGPALAGVALLAFPLHGHLLQGFMAVFFPLALLVFYGVLRRQEETEVAVFPLFSHYGAAWLVMALLPLELAWFAGHWWPGVALWPVLAWGVSAAVIVWTTQAGQRRGVWPFCAHPEAYLETILLPALVLSILWPFYANFTQSGAWGLPYLPVLNPLDAVLFAVIFSLLRWRAASLEIQNGNPSDVVRFVQLVLAAQIVVGISALAARITHFWGGVAFHADALFRSALFQGLLSLLWTLTALGLMVYAARAGRRSLWFGGFGLLVAVGLKLMLVDLANAGTLTWSLSLIGVALLVIAGSYFAPLPPKEDEAAA